MFLNWLYFVCLEKYNLLPKVEDISKRNTTNTNLRFQIC
jgi:hypothetical protein